MNTIKTLLKVFAAGIVAVAIICVLLCFYYIYPVHEENPKGNTDYVWASDSIWVDATEGISFGKNDANGFNNQVVVENPDILIIGSSHMEAHNVMQKDNTTYLLSEKFKDYYSVYNTGISGHTFYKACQYIPANLDFFDTPPKIFNN